MDIILGSLICLIPVILLAGACGLLDGKPEDKNKPMAKRSRPLKWGSSKKF